MTEWAVTGYDVLDLLGFGSRGEVWRARVRGSGELVVLRRLAGGDRAAVAAVRAATTVVRSLPSTHVVRLRTTARAQRDDVLVMDHAAAGSLASLLARRGTLAPGEVVTLLAPLAEALGQAHDRDLVHGRVRATEVLLTADGRPLLDGLGLTALHDPEDSLDPTGALGSTADVWALGALGHLALTGQQPGAPSLAEVAPTAPAPLVRALDSALAFDPADRPTAADLAAALLAACPALPLQGLVPADVPPAPQGSRRLPRPDRRVLVGAAAAVALAGVALVGQAWGRHSVPPVGGVARVSAAAVTPVSAAPAPAAVDWAQVLHRLDAARAEAFARGDAGLLAAVYAPGAPARAQDERAIADLTAQGRTARGLTHVVTQVRATAVTPDAVTLRVREALPAYALVGLDGTQEVAAGPVVARTVVLTRTAQGWRVSQLS